MREYSSADEIHTSRRACPNCRGREWRMWEYNECVNEWEGVNNFEEGMIPAIDTVDSELIEYWLSEDDVRYLDECVKCGCALVI